MQQRVEISSHTNNPAIQGDCTEITLAILDEAARASLVLPLSVTQIQVTGKGSLYGLALKGEGQIVRLVASSPRFISELYVDKLILEVANVTMTRLYFLRDTRDHSTSGVCFAQTSNPVSLAFVSAQERMVIRAHNSRGSLGLFADGRSRSLPENTSLQNMDSNSDVEATQVSVRELRVPDLVLDTGVSLTLQEWAATVKDRSVGIVLARKAQLRLTGSGGVGPLTVSGSEGSLELDSAIAEQVTGVLGCLTTIGPSVLRGSGLQLNRLRCGPGADISGLVVQSLDQTSLSHAAQASAFDVVLPTDRSWHAFHASSTCPIWWREPTAWRTLYQQLEQKGRPATAAWARRMEREARRTSASRSSFEYAVLEGAHLLGYGESVLRPLLAQAFFAFFACVLIILTSSRSPNYNSREFALFVQLYFAPLQLLRSGAFVSGIGTSIVDTVAWVGVLLSGAVCFGTTALAVRRLLAYS